jgi:hypothetical protein
MRQKVQGKVAGAKGAYLGGCLQAAVMCQLKLVSAHDTGMRQKTKKKIDDARRTYVHVNANIRARPRLW